MDAQTETLEFQAEARQFLQLVIHSIYSNKDVFLRELISNASDALDKLRLEALREGDIEADTSDLHILLEIDKEQRTLTIRDRDVIEYCRTEKRVLLTNDADFFAYGSHPGILFLTHQIAPARDVVNAVRHIERQFSEGELEDTVLHVPDGWI